MTKQELQTVFRATYKRKDWKQVLLNMFPEAEMFAQDKSVLFTRKEQKNLAKKIAHFGEVELDDDSLIFLEVELKPNAVHLERNRVGLRKLVDNEVVAGLTDAALITYYQPETEEWRITFYSERYGWDEDGNTIKEETHAKRYTYVVGNSEELYKTASQQLDKVIAKGTENTLKSVLEAFSVQKVSKEFFKEYKHQYDKFVGHLTGKNWTKKGVKETGKRITQFQFFFKDKSDPEKEARDFVKKLLGRIVFLHFVQKKQWLGATDEKYSDGDTNFIYNLYKEVSEERKADFYKQWLTKLFFDTLNTDDAHTFAMPDGSEVYIPFLNGGLFERDETDKNTAELPLPAALFSNPEDTETPETRGFLDFLSAFNFTIHEDSPGDHTIAVDPEMLGHIFENLLEDNKEKGAYYTPKPIVHYMCQESLIEYLLTELTSDNTKGDEKDKLRAHLEGFIKKQEAKDLVPYMAGILRALKEVKVCDPAIGSGAFPMGILQEIYQAVETLHLFKTDDVVEILELPDNDWHPALVKKQIIQHSIYGVDIEKGAVDIARLRFWLSLIVDEEEPTALPNLDYKIVVGDSLVSKVVLNGKEQVVEINWDITHDVESLRPHVEQLKAALDSIVKKQKAFFDSDIETKKVLRDEIKKLKMEALIHQLKYDREYYGTKVEHKGNAFPTSAEIKHNTERDLTLAGFTKTIKELEQARTDKETEFQHFDWKLDFPEVLNPAVSEKPGFDIVIANPPYIKEATNKDAFIGLHNSKYYQGKLDIWYVFGSYALDFLKNNGVVTFIATNNWITNDGASKFRNKILEESKIKQFIDFGDFKVFNSAGIQTMILLAQKTQSKRGANIFYGEVLNESFERKMLSEFLRSKVHQNNSFKRQIIEFDAKKYKDKYISFIETEDQVIIKKITEFGNFHLGYNEVHSGADILQESVTKKHLRELSGAEKGDGIFVISGSEKQNINFSENELKFIKPFYTTNELKKYFSEKSNKYWLIYADRRVYGDIQEFPNIRMHLDQFTDVMTSVNAPYGLHRSREEEIFQGEKILATRKCSVPTFSYSDFPCYVSRTFLIIKPNSIPAKLLTGILNSSLIKFWLERKGKMQGSNFQIDVTPVREIPIHNPEVDPGIADLVNQILTQKEANPEADTTTLEQEIDLLVYKLYNLTREEVQVVDPEFGMSEAEYEGVWGGRRLNNNEI